jgi:hypothetical protein
MAEGTPGDSPIMVNVEKVDHTGKFIAIFVILGLLIIGEVYFITRVGSLRIKLEADQAQLARKLNNALSAQVQQLSNANAQSLEELRSSLDDTASQMSATEKRALARARYASHLIRNLETQESHNAQELRQEIAQKADQQQVGSLKEDVTSAQSSLAATKKSVSTLASDLGMARSQLGTLIATNHNDIVALQKRGRRDYYEFDLVKNKQEAVAGITLILKKSNLKHHVFNMNMIYNDITVTRKNLAIDSPVFFAPRSAHEFYELVVYRLEPGSVRGYISTPKGAVTEVASQSNGAASNP